MRCPHCDGDRPPTFLGILGVLAWFRCRMCGGEFDGPADEIDIPEDLCAECGVAVSDHSGAGRIAHDC